MTDSSNQLIITKAATTNQNCDVMETIRRVERDSTDPEIHYGTILSGNMLVKDAATRD
jgi:hypothetical protein